MGSSTVHNSLPPSGIFFTYRFSGSEYGMQFVTLLFIKQLTQLIDQIGFFTVAPTVKNF